MFFFKRKKKTAAKTKKVLRKKRAEKAKAPKKKKIIAKAPKVSKGKEVLVGRATHYFPHVKAGAIMIEKGTIAIGDRLHIKGHTTDFKQKVASLQINRVPVEKASKGDEIGVLVKSRVRINDKVYKIT